MKIFAIETSCDETACAIVENGRTVLASKIASQIAIHTQYGGVVPEVAAREHLLMVDEIISQTLHEAQLTPDDIDAFAATLGPGLIGSLIVGVQSAKTLSWITQKPFIGVNHLDGHIASNYLDSELKPPFLCLLVSGGHTQLRLISDYSQNKIIGETLDDAVGESYDKVARLLGLPYPGGPNVDKLAKAGSQNPEVIQSVKLLTLPNPQTQNEFDFSLSGLKTAVSRQFEKLSDTIPLELLQQLIAWQFQERVVKMLTQKTVRAAEEYNINTVAIAGGVAANSRLREELERVLSASQKTLFVPQLKYCTDNAAMIASAAFFTPISNSLDADVFSRGCLQK